MAATTPRPRLALIAAAALAVALAGCAPITTQRPYAPGDGVRAQVGEQVQAENLMVVTEAEGAAGVLTGALTNVGDAATAVTLSLGGLTIEVPVDAGQTVLLTAPDAQESDTVRVQDVSVAAVPDGPGALTDVTLATPEGGSVTVAVPVLDGTLSQYRDLLP